MLPVPTAMVIPVEISEAAFLATTSIVSSKLVEEEDDDDEEVASPSSLLLLLLFDDDDDDEDDDDDDAEKTNPLPLLFCVLFVFAFLLAKNKRLICFRQLDDLNEDDEDEEEKEVLVLAERVLGDAKQTLPDILESSVFLFIIIVEKVHFREKKKREEKNEQQRQHANKTNRRVPPTCPLPLPPRRRRLYRSGYARTTSWRSVT